MLPYVILTPDNKQNLNFNKRKDYRMHPFLLENEVPANAPLPALAESGLAVLIIDMQPFYVRSLGFWPRRSLIKQQKKILRFCAENDVPVIILESKPVYEPEHEQTILQLARIAQKASRNTVIIKSHADGFRNTRLQDALRAWNVRILIVTGVYANWCMYQTCETAIEQGYSVITGYELMAGPRNDPDLDSWREKWYKRYCIFSSDWLARVKTLLQRQLWLQSR